MLLSRLRRRTRWGVLSLAFVGFVEANGSAFAHADAEPPHPSQAGLLYFVNTTSDTVVTGACQNGQAGCSLRGAILAANAHPGADGIEIDLSFGSVINLTGVLPDITEGVSITGPFPSSVTVQRNTGGTYRIFTVTTASSVTFSGLIINNGVGGISNSNAATVSVINSTLSNNAATGGLGGGIYNNSTGTVNVINSTLNQNSADAGGSIFNNSTGTINITQSTIVNSHANNGGGAIRNFSTGAVNVTSSLFVADNSGSGSGGAIYNDTGTLYVTNCTFYFNGTQNGASGGGIFNATGTVRVSNSTLTGNSTSGGGGGGGGIFNLNGIVSVQSSLIALNTAAGAFPDVGGDFNSLGFNLIGQRDGSTGFTTNPTDQTGTVALPLDPQLDPHGAQNHGGATLSIPLLFGSPAIDKGINALTTLSSAVNSSATSVGAVDAGSIPAGVSYTIQIDNEQMVVNSKAGNVLSVTRGANGTTAASHSAGTIIGSAFDQRGPGFPRAIDFAAVPNATNGTDVGATESVDQLLRITSIVRLTNGHIVLQGLGVPNAMHAIDVAPDPDEFSFMALPTTVTADGNGLIQYDDNSAVGLTTQFYRLRFPP